MLFVATINLNFKLISTMGEGRHKCPPLDPNNYVNTVQQLYNFTEISVEYVHRHVQHMHIYQL